MLLVLELNVSQQETPLTGGGSPRGPSGIPDHSVAFTPHHPQIAVTNMTHLLQAGLSLGTGNAVDKADLVAAPWGTYTRAKKTAVNG